MKSLRFAGRVVGVSVLIVAIAGCGLFSSQRDRALRRSPSFQEGYSDGCAASTAQSSNFRTGPYRDEASYQSDPTYRAGWSNGYQSCRATSQGVPNPGASPIAPPFPGR